MKTQDTHLRHTEIKPIEICSGNPLQHLRLETRLVAGAKAVYDDLALRLLNVLRHPAHPFAAIPNPANTLDVPWAGERSGEEVPHNIRRDGTGLESRWETTFTTLNQQAVSAKAMKSCPGPLTKESDSAWDAAR